MVISFSPDFSASNDQETGSTKPSCFSKGASSSIGVETLKSPEFFDDSVSSSVGSEELEIALKKPALIFSSNSSGSGKVHFSSSQA